MKEAVPAALFEQFLAANRHDEGFDFSPLFRPGAFRRRPGLCRRWNLRAEFNAPVISISRAGYRDSEDALVCVEVFASEERAFYVLLDRDQRGLAYGSGEMTAWRAPKSDALRRRRATESKNRCFCRGLPRSIVGSVRTDPEPCPVSSPGNPSPAFP